MRSLLVGFARRPCGRGGGRSCVLGPVSPLFTRVSGNPCVTFPMVYSWGMAGGHNHNGGNAMTTVRKEYETSWQAGWEYAHMKISHRPLTDTELRDTLTSLRGEIEQAYSDRMFARAAHLTGEKDYVSRIYVGRRGF